MDLKVLMVQGEQLVKREKKVIEVIEVRLEQLVKREKKVIEVRLEKLDHKETAV